MQALRDLFSRAADGDSQALLAIASVYCLAMAAYSLVVQLRMRAWPSVTGRLIEDGLAAVSGSPANLADQDFIVDAVYEYEVGGTRYRGSKISPWVIVASHNARPLLAKQLERVDVDARGRVRVYHHPTKPSKAILVPPGRFGLAVTIAFGLLPLLLLLIG